MFYNITGFERDFVRVIFIVPLVLPEVSQRLSQLLPDFRMYRSF